MFDSQKIKFEYRKHYILSTLIAYQLTHCMLYFSNVVFRNDTINSSFCVNQRDG